MNNEQKRFASCVALNAFSPFARTLLLSSHTGSATSTRYDIPVRTLCKWHRVRDSATMAGHYGDERVRVAQGPYDCGTIGTDSRSDVGAQRTWVPTSLAYPLR